MEPREEGGEKGGCGGSLEGGTEGAKVEMRRVCLWRGRDAGDAHERTNERTNDEGSVGTGGGVGGCAEMGHTAIRGRLFLAPVP